VKWESKIGTSLHHRQNPKRKKTPPHTRKNTHRDKKKKKQKKEKRNTKNPKKSFKKIRSEAKGERKEERKGHTEKGEKEGTKLLFKEPLVKTSGRRRIAVEEKIENQIRTGYNAIYTDFTDRKKSTTPPQQTTTKKKKKQQEWGTSKTYPLTTSSV